VGERETYKVDIAGVTRALPLFEVAPGVRIAVFNLLGDTEIIQVAARGLAKELEDVGGDVLVTAETKSVPLLYQLAVAMEKPWVVLRKAYKPYMGKTLTAETLSITTGAPQTLFLDEKDQELVRGKSVVLVDDVVTTGSTFAGMHELMEKAGARVVCEAAVFTEGDPEKWRHVRALGHLPVFTS
jgi:adenine/guanine phosphoribosyltransferase-like PRPP-binding protein